MKNFPLILVLIGLFINVRAQTVKVEMVDVKELKGGPILFLKNGSIVFLSAVIGATREKERLMIVDRTGKVLAEKVLEFANFKIGTNVTNLTNMVSKLGYYEIGGKIVLFVKVNKLEEESRCGLFRVTINPQTAEIEKEELIEMLHTVSVSGAMPVKGIEDSPHIYVVKDPNSDCYGIIKYQNQKKNPEKSSFAIVHYSGNHKVINSTNFDYIENKYDYARPIDFYIDGEQSIFLVSSVFNSEKGKDKDLTVHVSKVQKGRPMVHRALNYSVNMEINSCFFRKNIQNKTIELLFPEKIDFESYRFLFQNVNYETMEISKPYNLPNEKLNAYAKEKLGLKDGYTKGFVKKCIVDKDGNNLVSLMKNVTSFGDDWANSENPETIGVSQFDVNGREINSWAFPYNAPGQSFLFFSNKSGRYILLNNDDDNYKRPFSEKYDKVDKVDETNLVLLTLKDNGEFGQKFIFGPPVNGESRNTGWGRMWYDPYSDRVIAFYYDAEMKKSDYKKNTKLCFISIE